ncbi:MAG: PAS domain S-box protein, partial [Fimbriimonadaceae bacterium]|nr:PAS domain S-box protein [Fimbriimonadaceae bacterium]
MEWARRQHRRGNGASTAVVGALLVLLVGAILATGYEYRHRESRLDLRLQLREEAAQAANLGARVLIAAGDYSVNRKGAREDRRSLLEALDAFRTSRLADSARFAVDPTDEDLSRRIRSLVLFERESAGRIEFAVDNLLRADALNLRRARGAAVDRAVGGYAEAAEGLLLAADRSLDSQLDASWIRLAIFSLVLGAAPLGLFACFLAWNRRLKLSLQESLQTAAEMAEVNEHLETAKAELQEQRAELEAALDQANGQSELFEHASIRFQQLFGGLPVGCLTFDSMGLIQEWNLEMTELTGLEGYMACYHPLTSVFPAASRDFIEAMVRQVTTDGERVNFDSKLVRTGVEVRAHMVAYPLRNGRGEILGGILAGLNITAREEARESLRISEQRLETAMAATGAGHFEWDLKTDSVYWSPRIFEILATTPEETTPVRNFMIDRMHPEDG